MSRYTKQDIFNMVEEEDVEFIRLQFTDMFGTLKNVAITSSQLEKALSNECMTVRPLRDLSVSRSRICICIRILTRL
jgi:glutamine synthetase